MMIGNAASALRTKIKIPQNQRFHGIFDGRSDWIRTSGHLNPILRTALLNRVTRCYNGLLVDSENGVNTLIAGL